MSLATFARYLLPPLLAPAILFNVVPDALQRRLS